MFIAICILTKEAGIGGHQRHQLILNLSRYFLYTRIAHTLSAVFGLPTLVTCVCYLCGFSVNIMVLIPWKYHYGWGYSARLQKLSDSKFRLS